MPRSDPPRALGDTVVIDLSSGIAGAYCTKLLADAGAHVVKVEAPEGDPLRRWSASGADIPDGEDGALFSFLTSSKQSTTAEPDDADGIASVRTLLRAADAVVWSRGSRLGDHPDLAPDTIRRLAPHLTVTAITPFGLDGPWRDHAATEFTLQAWSGGIVGLGRGAPDRAPVAVGGQVGEWLTGAWAAIATLASRARGAGGALVDVSMLETIAMCLTYEPVTFAEMIGRPFRTGRSVITPGVETTSDGLVGVGVGTGQQWLDFCVMVDHPEWMEDRSLFANRAHLAPQIATWMAERTTAEVLELAGALRIPHAPINNGATAPATDHLRERGSFSSNPRAGFLEPDRPYRFDPPLGRMRTPAPTLGAREIERRERHSTATPAKAEGGLPYTGLRVLDLTAFWAGPLCTHGLAMLGADVIHLESTARPDGTRFLTGLRFTEPDWWERSGIFSGLNTNKKSLTIDLSEEAGRTLLHRLIDTCDVLVENFTPRVLEQLGLDIDGLRSDRPDLIVVRMPGFGLDGPWRDNPAFAFVIEDAAGLTWLTGHPDQNPVSPYCVGDSNAGTHALIGLMLAIAHRQSTGEGVLVEASMLDAALQIAAEQVVEHSAYGALLEREGNRGPAAAPQNLYLAADTDEDGERDSWVAIAVAADAQWLALRDAIGQPEWAMDAALETRAGRRADHDLIDRHLSEWCASRAGDEIVEELWPAGVPVAKVLQPHEQATLPQLQARGFFEPVTHPVAGVALHRTLPFRFSDHDGPMHRAPAPCLGQHNEQELTRLGLSGAEIAGLEAAGVIGSVPDAARKAMERAQAREKG